MVGYVNYLIVEIEKVEFLLGGSTDFFDEEELKEIEDEDLEEFDIPEEEEDEKNKKERERIEEILDSL